MENKREVSGLTPEEKEAIYREMFAEIAPFDSLKKLIKGWMPMYLNSLSGRLPVEDLEVIVREGPRGTKEYVVMVPREGLDQKAPDYLEEEHERSRVFEVLREGGDYPMVKGAVEPGEGARVEKSNMTVVIRELNPVAMGVSNKYSRPVGGVVGPFDTWESLQNGSRGC